MMFDKKNRMIIKNTVRVFKCLKDLRISISEKDKQNGTLVERLQKYIPRRKKKND
jgi:hypothetical protein